MLHFYIFAYTYVYVFACLCASYNAAVAKTNGSSKLGTEENSEMMMPIVLRLWRLWDFLSFLFSNRSLKAAMTTTTTTTTATTTTATKNCYCYNYYNSHHYYNCNHNNYDC